MASKNGPGQMRSVLHELPVFRTGDPQVNMDRAVALAGTLDTAAKARQRYREAILAVPDLAERLRLVLGYSDIGKWTGYVPARSDDSDRPNSSPIRAAMVEIVSEAVRRAGLWQPYDTDYLAPVPERYIKAPWQESGVYAPTDPAIARVLAEGGED